MPLTTEFKPLELDQLRREAAVLKADGWRFMQTHAVNAEAGIDLYYSFMKDGHAVNYRIAGVTKDQPVPSITDLFLAAFVFENEARELFGVDMRDIALDFHGAMYAPAQAEPMTFITPEQKAAKEKAAKAASAKAEKEAAATAAPSGAGTPAASGRRVFVMTPELQARLDAKLPTLSDEKRAKVEAALKARAEEAQAGADAAGADGGGGTPGESACSAKVDGQAPKQEAAPANAGTVRADSDRVLEAQIAAMDPEAAAKVRAALQGREAPPAAASGASIASPGGEGSPAGRFADEEVAKLLSMMSEEAAAKVASALSGEGGN